MKPAGGRSSMKSLRTSSYVAPPTLYERKRAKVSLFTGIVVVGITINIISLMVLIANGRSGESARRWIGERSSHTWFVLKYLLGYPDVRNYDGSWTEWGNLVRTPIEKP
jgi:hypothetical protein